MDEEHPVSSFKRDQRDPQKVLILAAHDDDSIIAMGGRIQELASEGKQILFVIGSDGRTSHSSTLGIWAKPSQVYVRETRRMELNTALRILGVAADPTYMDLPHGSGRVREDVAGAAIQIQMLLKEHNPETIFLNARDDHPEHVALNEAYKQAISDPHWPINYIPVWQYGFRVWLDPKKPIRRKRGGSVDVYEYEVPPEKMDKKRLAIYAFRSQVLSWPYPDWQIQSRPILGKNFLDYHLRGKEAFLSIHNYPEL